MLFNFQMVCPEGALSLGNYLHSGSSYLLFVSARREETCIRGCGRTTDCEEEAKSEIIGLEGHTIGLGDCDDWERG
jgi:hypothetical protein